VGSRIIEEREQAAVLTLIESEMDRPGAITSAAEDCPLALGPGSQRNIRVLDHEGRIGACLACLVRPYRTSLGILPVAALGSVVTHPSARRRGLSARLQEDVLRRLRQGGIPLAVLWSDRPELYRGRGFRAAGVEHHVDLLKWRPADPRPPAGWRIRDYRPGDSQVVAMLYTDHEYHTVRGEAEHCRLYGMPGTRGLVLVDRQDRLQAYLFCGKGADFAGCVLEWGGRAGPVATLLATAAAAGLARWALVPQGEEALRDSLVAEGAASSSRCSGLWCLLDSEPLVAAGRVSSPDAIPEGSARKDPGAWLGQVGGEGYVREGPLRLAVWGFDSI
jgi:GNAT superfamily N-acetyltransferase